MPDTLKRPAREGLRERKKRLTREELLSVAQTLFTESDFSDVTIEQIVARANVSPKTFFNYFQNKAQFLEESMLHWLKGIGFWAIEDDPVSDCRSALIPSDAHETLDWVIENRRMFRMAMVHTGFFDFIYRLDRESEEFVAELHGIIRQPRVERVLRGQLMGVVRKDVSADDICRMYDVLRIDAVKRWLFLEDDAATRDALHERYETLVDCLIKGIST